MYPVTVEKNFEHSYDQAIFRMPLSKKIIKTVTEVVLMQESFLTVGS